jgi:hypothetical protein
VVAMGQCDMRGRLEVKQSRCSGKEPDLKSRWPATDD